MRDPNRIPRLLRKLEMLWSQPGINDQRLGQLLSNINDRIHADPSLLYNVEDTEWEELLDEELIKKGILP